MELNHLIEAFVNISQQVPSNTIQTLIPYSGPDCLIEDTINGWDRIRDPSWGDFLDTFEEIPLRIITEIEKDFSEIFNGLKLYFEHKDVLDNLITIKTLDWARDHHHYDILTSQQLVKEIIKKLDR